MVPSELGTDAAFYELIHHLLEEQPGDAMGERREGFRKPFPILQRIAPCHDGKVPPDSAFTEVRCHDLTQKGFSFFLPRPPCFDRLIVAFGERPRCIYLVAEVLHCNEVTVDEATPRETPSPCCLSRAAGGPPVETPPSVVLVGCRFVERLDA